MLHQYRSNVYDHNAALRETKKYLNDLKAVILKLYSDKKLVRKITELIGLPKSSVTDIFVKYKERGTIEKDCQVQDDQDSLIEISKIFLKI